MKQIADDRTTSTTCVYKHLRSLGIATNKRRNKNNMEIKTESTSKLPSKLPRKYYNESWKKAVLNYAFKTAKSHLYYSFDDVRFEVLVHLDRHPYLSVRNKLEIDKEIWERYNKAHSFQSHTFA